MESTVERRSGPDQQFSLLKEVDYAKISRGAKVPPMMILGHVPDGGRVLNVGCGPGDKVMEFAEETKAGEIKVVGVDLNPTAIARVNRLSEQVGMNNAVNFLVADAANDLVEKLNQAGYEESFNTVVAEGLFCNLLGDDPQRVLVNINKLLRLRGWLLVADCLRVDDGQAVSLLDRAGYSGEEILLWREKWLERYENNLALDLGLRPGEFLVVEPGDGSADDYKPLEFGEPEVLRKLIKRGQVERYARHWDRRKWNELVSQAGFEQRFWEDTIWKSRTNEPTLGMVAAFEKVVESG